MAEFKYRAFISYSHGDEVWAKWLHRALESYRVPKKLVGALTSAGEVPARIRPVFRDREDFSSASDLSESVKQVLAESENLIVICSPNAAASRWVGEEIREFARLRRKARIFCLVVGGEPDPKGTDESCFPPVLGEIGLTEPLAADVRSWADGKRLALLKLISGMMGVRLDDLRQRDQQRRRRLMTIAGFGILATIALVIMTIVSQISSKYEREKAEQMATFIVDIGEKLKSDTDLETLAEINAEAINYFRDLDPAQLSPDTGKQVALALRQVARVSQLQGKPEEALATYISSRDILAMLREKHREDSGLLYELSLAQYYTGNLYFKQGDYVNARSELEKNLFSTQLLLEIDPENPDWIMEHVYAHNNLAAMQLDSGISADEVALEHLDEAVRLMKKVIHLQPFDETKLSGYSNTLAYAADAHRGVCNLEKAMSLRETARELAEDAVESDPGNNDLIRRHAFAIKGVALLQTLLGRLDAGEQNLKQEIAMLQQLSAADPSNAWYRQLVRREQSLLAGWLAGNNQLEAAQSLMRNLEAEFDLDSESAPKDKAPVTDYIDFQLTFADVEARLGNKEAASRHLQIALEFQLASTSSETRDRFDRMRLLTARFLWWEFHGEDIHDRTPGFPDANPTTNGGSQSCKEADIAARMYVMAGDRSNALKRVNYLHERGYADPAFVRFCKKHGLCS